MFAVLIQERDPLSLADLPRMVESWVQTLGGVAGFGLAVWGLASLVQRLAPGLERGSVRPTDRQQPNGMRTLFAAAVSLVVAAYGLYFALLPLTGPSEDLTAWLTFAGALAIATVLGPFGLGLLRLRWRRIWALASLSFKEAVRSRVLWLSAAPLIFYLFADWFLRPKPADQLRTYTENVFLVNTILFLVTPVWIASRSIPADIGNQTIHTVVTKPVERFELVLGRFLGYAGLMTLWVIPMISFSLVYVLLHGVHPDAAAASLRARQAVYGKLELVGNKPNYQGIQPYEWRYRRYIAGGPDTPDRAIWAFSDLPAAGGAVSCEFFCEIFRMSKGEGVLCTLAFETWRWNPASEPAFRREGEALRRQGVPEAEADDRLAEKYGYFEVRYKEVVDYRTFTVPVPSGLFRNARQGQAGQEQTVTVTVKCESPGQYLGVARHDLYFLEGEGGFVLNLFKGAAGIWFLVCMGIGLSVAFSTYFSGVISFVLTLCVLGGGFLAPYIQNMATKASAGGGPAESFLRLINPQKAASAPIDDTPIGQVAYGADEAFRWLMRILVRLFPDVDRFNLTQYVSEGFDISGATLFLLALMLAGYLAPFLIGAYFLMGHREMAG